MSAAVCTQARCAGAAHSACRPAQQLAQLTPMLCRASCSLARPQALAARPAPRRHALPVRASRDAELKKMQEFKAGLNKHLEASKRPGATGEARRRACKALCWAPSADAAWCIAAVRQSVGSQHHESRQGTGAPLPPPCATAQAPPFSRPIPVASCSRRRRSSRLYRGASCRQEAAGGARIERGQGRMVPHSRPCASTLWRIRPVRCACCCHPFMRCLRRPLNPAAAGDPGGLL